MKKNRKHKKNKKLFWYAISIVVFFILIFLFFLFWPNNLESVYIYPKNPKQGDTVFVRVKSSVAGVTGEFDKEQLIFYQNGKSSEWIALLGIDAVHKPGDYKIIVDVPLQGKFEKDIKVELADFSLATALSAPSASQTGITVSRAESNIVNNDNPVLNKILSNFTLVPYFKSSFDFPLKNPQRTGIDFGISVGFNLEKMQHLGVDLKASEKTEVFSINDGKVVAVLDLSNYGKTVIIDHGLDVFSLYLHLSEFKISEGNTVKKGQLIGLSGSTGYVTAPHLHFSVRVGSSRVDPINFIEASQKADENILLASLKQAFNNIFK